MPATEVAKVFASRFVNAGLRELEMLPSSRQILKDFLNGRGEHNPDYKEIRTFGPNSPETLELVNGDTSHGTRGAIASAVNKLITEDYADLGYIPGGKEHFGFVYPDPSFADIGHMGDGYFDMSELVGSARIASLIVSDDGRFISMRVTNDTIASGQGAVDRRIPGLGDTAFAGVNADGNLPTDGNFKYISNDAVADAKTREAIELQKQQSTRDVEDQINPLVLDTVVVTAKHISKSHLLSQSVINSDIQRGLASGNRTVVREQRNGGVHGNGLYSNINSMAALGAISQTNDTAAMQGLALATAPVAATGLGVLAFEAGIVGGLVATGRTVGGYFTSVPGRLAGAGEALFGFVPGMEAVGATQFGSVNLGIAARFSGALGALGGALAKSGAVESISRYASKALGDIQLNPTFSRAQHILNVNDSAKPLVDSLRSTGQLPPNYITQDEAIALGWSKGKSVTHFLGDKRIGGDIYHNFDNLLPAGQGRTWTEADLSFLPNSGRRSADRLVYSNDGLAYVTHDHYESFTPYLGGNWK